MLLSDFRKVKGISPDEVIAMAENGRGPLLSLDLVAVGRALYHEDKGLPKDQSKAIELWEKAVEEENASAMFELGRAYTTG